jgi:phospholipid/cholesterol/gamma-HCH transport system ATP-binding protein
LANLELIQHGVTVRQKVKMGMEIELETRTQNNVRSSILSLENVSIHFDNEIILQNINLSVEEGESFVVIGPSGQGKSVLLKLMSGLIPPTSGKIIIEGLDWHGSSKKQQAVLLQTMGMLFQKNALFDSMTVAENVAFPMRATTNWSEPEIQEKVNYFLDAVGILHAKDLFPDEISGGMQKRLGIARALALKPKIIFYDDPTAGLDPITSRMIIDLIKKLQKENGSTVVAITNDMNRAYQMADRIGMVVQKELVITGTVAATKAFADARVQQFIHGSLTGSLTSLE